jgi:hypothetical protein
MISTRSVGARHRPHGAPMGSLFSGSSTTSSQSQTRQRRRAVSCTVLELLERTGIAVLSHHALQKRRSGRSLHSDGSHWIRTGCRSMLERSGMLAAILDRRVPWPNTVAVPPCAPHVDRHELLRSSRKGTTPSNTDVATAACAGPSASLHRLVAVLPCARQSSVTPSLSEAPPQTVEAPHR